MDQRRYILFIVLSFGILVGYMQLTAMMRGPEQPAANGRAAADDQDTDIRADQDNAAEKTGTGEHPVPSEELTPGEEPMPGGEPAEPTVAAAAPVRWETLGSMDPESPYRMLVTMDNRGGVIHRLELNSPRYRKSNDRSGYLGNLVVDPSTAEVETPVRGCRVQVVGPGTPAAKAGLKVDDIITNLNQQQVHSAEDIRRILSETRHNQTVKLEYRRDGQQTTVDAKLAWTPLQLIRPAGEDIPGAQEMGLTDPKARHDSMSMTLKSIVGEGIQPQEVELAGFRVGKEIDGLDLWQGTWHVMREATGTGELIDPGADQPAGGVDLDPDAVYFVKDLPKYGLRLKKAYRLTRAAPESPDAPGYALDFDLSVSLLDSCKDPRTVVCQLDGPSGLVVEGIWYARASSRNWSTAGFRDIVASFRGQEPLTANTTTINLDSKVDKLQIWRDTPVSFAAVDCQYFAAALIPDRGPQKDPAANPEPWFQNVRPIRIGPELENHRLANTSFRMVGKEITLSPKTAENPDAHTKTYSFTLFAGPKRPELLAQYEGGIGQLVYYGWFGWVARPMVAVLHFFYSLVGNYGIAIVLLTIVVRLLMYPLSRQQVLGAQKMAALQPEMKALQERYKNDMQAKSRAQQELFRKHNCNPLSGCLVMFIQLPIFIALYRGLMVDVELRQAPLISESIRWCSDLAAPDMLFNWSGFMPAFINSGEGIFGLGPYFNLLPILTIVLFIAQQKILMPPPADEQQAMQQKMMKFMMIFIGVLFYKVASGLCLYFIASSVWGLAERQLMPKPEPKKPEPITRADAKERAKARKEFDTQRRETEAKKGGGKKKGGSRSK